MKTAKKKNFLIFVTDQQRADHLGCYGNRQLKTPHIDALAEQGALFDRFYASSAVCMSNRATLMTGRMPSVHGVRSNGIPLSRDHTTFVEILSAAGYQTALVGKSHLQNFGEDGPRRPVWANANGGDAPPAELRDAHKARRVGVGYEGEWTPHFEAQADYRTPTPFYGFDSVDLCTFHADNVRADYSRWLEARHPNSESLRGKVNAIPDTRYIAPQAWRTRIPEELYPTNYVAEHAIARLKQASQSDAPFFIQCSFPDPHHPFTPPGKYWDMYDPAAIDLPKSFNNVGAVDHSPLIAALRLASENGELNRERAMAMTVSERECREMIALTYGMISCIDDAVGRVMATLKDLGLDDDTVVMFTSDHGDWMGDHGLMLKGPLHYQGVIRVPFVCRIPGVDHRAVRNSGLAGTIDIAATVLDIARLAPYNGIQGKSLLPAAQGGETPVRAGMLVENEAAFFQYGTGKRFRVRTLVTERWRLTLSDMSGIAELYDLVNDPMELTNLWGDASTLEITRELTHKLITTMIEHQDLAPLPTAIA